jgi:hypothetical protein
VPCTTLTAWPPTEGCSSWTAPTDGLLLAAKHAALKAEHAETLGRIVRETEATTMPERSAPGATLGGDALRMRGVPCVGRGGAGGAIAGSDPLKALLAKERRTRRR